MKREGKKTTRRTEEKEDEKNTITGEKRNSISFALQEREKKAHLVSRQRKKEKRITVS